MKKINLGVKNNWWKLNVFLLSPFWFLSTRTWEEFKYGLIKHECSFDYKNPISDRVGRYYECKHFGCYIVSMKNKDGTWTWEN